MAVVGEVDGWSWSKRKELCFEKKKNEVISKLQSFHAPDIEKDILCPLI